MTPRKRLSPRPFTEAERAEFFRLRASGEARRSERAERRASAAEALAAMPPVRCPYSLKDRFREAFPDARWDAAGHTWRVPAEDKPPADEWLERRRR